MLRTGLCYHHIDIGTLRGIHVLVGKDLEWQAFVWTVWPLKKNSWSSELQQTCTFGSNVTISFSAHHRVALRYCAIRLLALPWSACPSQRSLGFAGVQLDANDRLQTSPQMPLSDGLTTQALAISECFYLLAQNEKLRVKTELEVAAGSDSWCFVYDFLIKALFPSHCLASARLLFCKFGWSKERPCSAWLDLAALDWGLREAKKAIQVGLLVWIICIDIFCKRIRSSIEFFSQPFWEWLCNNVQHMKTVLHVNQV